VGLGVSVAMSSSPLAIMQPSGQLPRQPPTTNPPRTRTVDATIAVLASPRRATDSASGRQNAHGDGTDGGIVGHMRAPATNPFGIRRP